MPSNLTPVGPPHVIGGVIHTQILEDASQTDPSQRFWADINVPGLDEQMQIGNNQSMNIKLPVSVAGFASPTLQVKVENFNLAPPGSNNSNATALSFLLVFRVVEIFYLTVGSVPVTANLK
jgi:hypothetical protein